MAGYPSQGRGKTAGSATTPSIKIGERAISTIIIGGNGRAAIQKLVDHYPTMSADQKAAAVALEAQFVQDVDALCAGGDEDQDEQ